MINISEAEKAELIQATLDWCNEIRQEEGLLPLAKLPKGKQADPNSCPCGKATGYVVTMASFYKDNFDVRQIRTLPNNIQKFVYYFDNGYIPELVEGRRELE